MRARISLFLLAAAAALAPAARAGDAPSIESAQAEWRVARNRPLGEKVAAARRLAETRDPAALKELLSECAREGKHQDKFRELIAPQVADRFRDPKFAAGVRAALLSDLKDPEHAWLAYQFGAAWIRDGHANDALDLYMRADALPFHQAAALRALASTPDPTALALARDVLSTLPVAEPQRTLLLEAAARVVETNAPAGGGPAALAAVEPILAHLDDKTTTRRTTTVLGRVLARILKSTTVYADAASWRRFIEDKSAAAKLAKEGYAPAVSYFAGVTLTGRDIVFVIDLSGSMSEPFTWRPQAPATPSPPPSGPITGKGADEAERRQREELQRREQDVFKSLAALPWDKIKCRLDAVREALKATLRGLQEDQRFAVVTFSSEARFLSTARTLMPATRANVETACADVDRFGPGGGTNIHRAMELAFGASREKDEDPASGTNADLILRGADTVVLLTDGTPTSDSYDLKGELYAEPDNIRGAVRRWNLFMDAEVDCVGLALPNDRLLAPLAADHGGEARFLGK